MDSLDSVALLAAALIVLSRLYILLWPARFRKLLAGFWKKRHSLTAAALLVAGLGGLAIVLSQLKLSAVVSSIFAFGMLAGALMLWEPSFGKAVSEALYKKSENWLRIRAAVAVALGVATIYFVLQSAS